MGQRHSSSARTNESSSSSSRSASTPSTPTLSSSVSDAGRPEISSPGRSTTSSRRSNRQSFRKSVLGLVHSRSNARYTGEGGLLNELTSGDQKRWRSSRRWSKAPVRFDTPTTSDSAPNADSHNTTSVSMQSTASISEDPASAVSKGKGKEKAPADAEYVLPDSLEAQQSADAPQPVHPGILPSSQSDSLQSPHVQDSAPLDNGVQLLQAEGTDQNTLSRSPGISDPDLAESGSRVATTTAEVHKENSEIKGQMGASAEGQMIPAEESLSSSNFSSDIMPPLRSDLGSGIAAVLPGANSAVPSEPPLTRTENPSDPLHTPGPIPQQREQPTPAARQFPPPGTLVVVQGVVHTTDTPRPSLSDNSSSTSASPTDTTSSRDASSSEDRSDAISASVARGDDNGISDAAAIARQSRTFQSAHRNSILASLLRRRNSMSNVAATERTSGGEPSLPRTEASSRQTVNESRRNEVSADTTSTPLNSTAATSAGDAQPRRPGQLSSNSIDVLGTLLSIATAATAASLVTGSSDSFFRSSHTNTLSSTLGSPSPSDPDTSSTSGTSNNTNIGIGLPAIARALAAANPTAAAAVARRELDRQREREREDSERHRMRNVWANLRERLGHARARANGNGLGVHPFSGRVREALTSSMNAGERAGPEQTGGLVSEALFNEIARAFNLGFNANGNTASTRSDEPSTNANDESEATQPQNSGSQRSSESAPPEGFEHFLVNLQSDLRDALLRMDNGGSTESEGSASEESGENARAPREENVQNNIGTSQSTTVDSVNAPALETRTLVSNTSEEADHFSSARPLDAPSNVPSPSEDSSATGNSDNAVEGPARNNATTLSLDEDEMASLVSVTTDGEDDGGDESEDEESTIDDTDFSESIIPIAQPILPPNSIAPGSLAQTASASEPTTTSGGSSNPRGGINWWRMYRFPPMNMTQTPQANRDLAVPISTPSPNAESRPSNERSTTQSAPPFAPSSSTTPSSPGTSSAAPSQQQSRVENNTNMVVPVIVVGLQSINNRQRNENNTTSPSQTPIPTSSSGSEAPATFRQDMNWQSRAARAMSQLSGRGAAADATRTSADNHDGPGSRTFFIYVFGGYYPPNHHIVTGPNSLDSFEALWELAELLGQVKAPIATREEIENSGLEIFKACNLPEYEASGKVLSSCVERCLVCLDDYDSDDDLRMMSCKHAFHKGCVDRWLETGRNNCPACRGKGVDTENRPVGSMSS